MNETLKRAVIAVASIAATISLGACSTSTNDAAPTTAAASSSALAAGQATGCEINPSSAPLPTAEKFEPVPADSRISVTLTGIPSGTIKPGDPPVEVQVKICNNSPVDYPTVGVVLVLTRCSCATSPMGLPEGSADRFDPATGNRIPLPHPVMGTGMDYIGGYENVQELPKGKTVTLKYRVALDPSMTDVKGGVEATVLMPDPLVQIGRADLPFTVSKESTTAPNGPRPTVLAGLQHPDGLAVDTAGDLYVIDRENRQVVKFAAGSPTPTAVPSNGLSGPHDVTVDGAGNVYVIDNSGFGQVLKLAAG